MPVADVKTHRQIFLSFAPQDRDLAGIVAGKLEDAGLEVIRFDKLRTGGVYSDAVRRAMKQSDAVVTVLSNVTQRNELPASVLFEVGAAMGAGKQVFVVLKDITEKLPFGVPNLHVLSLNRVGEIASRLDDMD